MDSVGVPGTPSLPTFVMTAAVYGTCLTSRAPAPVPYVSHAPDDLREGVLDPHLTPGGQGKGGLKPREML